MDMSPMMRSTFKNLLSPWPGGFLGILVDSRGQRTYISFFLNPSVWEGVGRGAEAWSPTLIFAPTASREQLLPWPLPLTGRKGEGGGSEQLTRGTYRSDTGWEGEGPNE